MPATQIRSHSCFSSSLSPLPLSHLHSFVSVMHIRDNNQYLLHSKHYVSMYMDEYWSGDTGTFESYKLYITVILAKKSSIFHFNAHFITMYRFLTLAIIAMPCNPLCCELDMRHEVVRTAMTSTRDCKKEKQDREHLLLLFATMLVAVNSGEWPSSKQ